MSTVPKVKKNFYMTTKPTPVRICSVVLTKHQLKIY